MQNKVNLMKQMVLGMEKAVGAELPGAREAVEAFEALAPIEYISTPDGQNSIGEIFKRIVAPETVSLLTPSDSPAPMQPAKAVTVGASTEQLSREFTEQVAPFATLNQWRDLIMAWADLKGWNDKSILDEKGEVRNEFLGEQLMLITTELAEAQEDNRHGRMATYLEGDGKPCGFPSELADAMIRIFHLSARLGIDLNREVAIKMAHNYSRARRHGGLRS